MFCILFIVPLLALYFCISKNIINYKPKITFNYAP